MLMKDEYKVENYLMNIGYHRLSAYIYPFHKKERRYRRHYDTASREVYDYSRIDCNFNRFDSVILR